MSAPNLYHYDPDGVLTEITTAVASPRDLELGETVWMIPARSTTVVPPVPGENETVRFADGEWSVVADLRGVVAFDTATRQPVVIAQVGELPDHLTLIEPPSANHVFDNGEWIEGPIPVPASVSAGQLIRALDQVDLLDTVDAAVAQADSLTQRLWARAAIFERSDPLIVGMAAAIGQTTEQLDDLFRLAATF
ncbi:MAG: hypothetical protein KF889_04905 [Alphaproteobacteria bacterium]|nr:hypothetical protein [Alphaproteobacteria bacterium]MCW5742208.1 hypothetical protein [Alphaproteobacteria bacterium]